MPMDWVIDRPWRPKLLGFDGGYNGIFRNVYVEVIVTMMREILLIFRLLYW